MGNSTGISKSWIRIICIKTPIRFQNQDWYCPKLLKIYEYRIREEPGLDYPIDVRSPTNENDILVLSKDELKSHFKKI